jgi:hypothetical protein
MPTKVILDVLGIGHRDVDKFVAVAESLIAMHEPTASEQALLDRYPSIELDGEVEWKPSFIIRGLESLPLAPSTT